MKYNTARRKLARQIAGAQPPQPPQCCRRCVWAQRETGVPACPFRRCILVDGWSRSNTVSRE